MTRLTAELDRTTVAAGGSAVTASVRIQPGMTDSDIERHIALCIDKSGSMAGEKMEQVREGIGWTFGYLDDDDHLSIVTFDDEVEVALPSTRWGDITLDEAEAVVEDLEPGGGTNIRQGLETAYETLADLPAGTDVARRVLLLSDGRDESTTTDTFAEIARQMRREDGISVPAAGIGDFYDEDTIRTVGTASDAEWVHLSRAADIKNFFGRKVETLRTIVAPRPNLEITLPEGATVEEVLLRQPQVREANYEHVDDTVRVFLPDLVEFETQEVVFTIHTPPLAAGETLTLADIQLNAPGETTSTAVEVQSTADTADMETRIQSADVAVRHVETMVRKAASEGELERAATIVKEATGETDVPHLPDQETQVRDSAPNDQETQVRDSAPNDQETQVRDSAPNDQETQIRDSGLDDQETQIRAPDPNDQETQIRGSGTEDHETRILDETTDDKEMGTAHREEDPADQETRIRKETIRDLRDTVDEETVAELNTVIETASAEDLEAQYETTKIKDTEGR